MFQYWADLLVNKKTIKAKYVYKLIYNLIIYSIDEIVVI